MACKQPIHDQRRNPPCGMNAPYKAQPDHYAYMARQVMCTLIIDSLCRASLRSNMAQGCNLRFYPGLQTFHPYRVISNLISHKYAILRALKGCKTSAQGVALGHTTPESIRRGAGSVKIGRASCRERAE